MGAAGFPLDAHTKVDGNSLIAVADWRQGLLCLRLSLESYCQRKGLTPSRGGIKISLDYLFDTTKLFSLI